MKREVKITFDEVKEVLKGKCPNYNEELVDATKNFSMYYIKYPFGFAETDNMNDISECINDCQMWFNGIAQEPDGRTRKSILKKCIKREEERWEQRNASFGRLVGRLAYLLNKEK